MRRSNMKKNAHFGSNSRPNSRFSKPRFQRGRPRDDFDFEGEKQSQEPQVEEAPLPTYVELGEQLSMNAAVMKSIAEMGFERPSPIQAQALPILLGESTDFLGLAATGTGKTAAFAIPLLHKIDPRVRGVQALVLCPTRELAIQVAGQIDLLGKHLGVKAVPVYGGASYGEQIRGISRGSAVVVGTPGRVQDHINQGTLSLDQVNLVVLDEADEMISMGFKESIESILSGVSEETSNIWLFSATMSRDVRDVADEFLENPKSIEVNRKEMLPESIEQLYYITQESNKPEVLCKLIDAADDFYGLVFCQTKALVTDVTMYLQGRGYRVDCLHGDKDQNERERTMQAFRDRKVTLLVCTDVASRGIDVKDVTHVINYSIPRELDSYVHRIGRTARSGKKGYAMSLITASGRGLISRIERMTKRRMFEGKIPTRKDIGKKKVEAFLNRFKSEAAGARALELMSADWKETLATLSAEEVASRFVAMTFPEIFAERTDFTGEARATLGQRPEKSGRRKEALQPSDSGMVIQSVNKNDAQEDDVATPRASLKEVAPQKLDAEFESEDAIETFFASQDDAPTAEATSAEKNAPVKKKFFEKKPYEKKSFESRPFESKSYEKRSFEKRPFEKKPFEKRSFEKKPFEKRSFDQSGFGKKREFDSSFFERKRGFEKGTFDGNGFDRNKSDRKPFFEGGRDGGSSWDRPRREGRFAPNPFERSSSGPRFGGGRDRDGQGPIKWAAKKGRPELERS